MGIGYATVEVRFSYTNLHIYITKRWISEGKPEEIFSPSIQVRWGMNGYKLVSVRSIFKKSQNLNRKHAEPINRMTVNVRCM